MDKISANPFTSGVVVFFRAFGKDGDNLARSVHPDGRNVALRKELAHPEDYVVLDKDGNTIGFYPRDWVAAILPLQTVGPANAPDQPTRRSDTPETEEGNTEGFVGRVKGLNS